MHRLDDGLKALIDRARELGYLTYQAVDEYLPDEGGEPIMVERIVQALEELDLPLINDPSAPRTVAEKTRLEQQLLEDEPSDAARVLIEPETPMSSRDPIRIRGAHAAALRETP